MSSFLFSLSFFFFFFSCVSVERVLSSPSLFFFFPSKDRPHVFAPAMLPGWPQCTSQSGRPSVEKNSAWPPRRSLKNFSRPRGPLSAAARSATFFFFFFFFFFLGKGFRESAREINRTKQTAAPPSVCQRGAYLCLLLSRRSRAQENREEKTSLTRGERREEAEVGRGRFRRRRRRRRRGAADDIGRFRRGPVGHLLRGARNGARGNRPASHHGPVHFQRASRERGAG